MSELALKRADDALPVSTPALTAPANRRESPILPPGLSDEEVVANWLAVKAVGRGRLSPTTLAQYRTEAERLFWYARRIGVPISSWTLPHFTGYIAFLQAPPAWALCPAGTKRGSPAWRPFRRPPIDPKTDLPRLNPKTGEPYQAGLSDQSAGQTQKIVTSLFDWLRDVGYLQVNPAVGMPTVGRTDAEKQGRFFSKDDCALMREAISARGEATREARLLKARDLFLIDLFELTGARTIEAMRGAMRDVKVERVPDTLRRQYPDAPAFQWLLRIPRGKGDKARWIPCNELALSLQAYRIAFDLPPLPSPGEDIPLVLSVRRGKFGDRLGLRSRTSVWNVIKGLGQEAISYAQVTGRPLDAAAAARLNQGSTHWIRHTYAKELADAIKSGRLEERAALENMGHSDRRTFNQYDDDEPLRRALATHMARVHSAR